MLQGEENLGEFNRCRLFCSFANFDHFLIFPLDLWIACRSSTNVLQYFESFLVAANRGEEPGRVR